MRHASISDYACFKTWSLFFFFKEPPFSGSWIYLEIILIHGESFAVNSLNFPKICHEHHQHSGFYSLLLPSVTAGSFFSFFSSTVTELLHSWGRHQVTDLATEGKACLRRLFGSLFICEAPSWARAECVNLCSPLFVFDFCQRPHPRRVHKICFHQMWHTMGFNLDQQTLNLPSWRSRDNVEDGIDLPQSTLVLTSSVKTKTSSTVIFSCLIMASFCCTESGSLSANCPNTYYYYCYTTVLYPSKQNINSIICKWHILHNL